MIALLEQLQSRVAAALADLGGRPFALVDFPDHANVGDSAIWLGTTAREALAWAEGAR